MKILVSAADAGEGAATAVQVSIYCPTATVEVRVENLDVSFAYAIANGFNLIARPTTGLDDDRIETIGADAAAANIGIVHSHGSNSHVQLPDPSYIGDICAVGYGDATPTNLGSYGPGLEFFAVAPNESQASGVIAGMIGQLMINHYYWSFDDARDALRQSASNYDSGYVEDGGYGLIDFDVANAILIPIEGAIILSTIISIKSLIETSMTKRAYVSADISYKKGMVNPINFTLAINVFLGEAYSGGVMRTDLNSLGFLPLSQPYSGAPWSYAGSESVASIPNVNITDWVLIQLRSDETTVVKQQAAFLLKTGQVVDLDGVSNISYSSPYPQFYIVIYHRNHLAIMTAQKVDSGVTYNFDSAVKAYGGQMKDLGGGVFGMYGGDANSNGLVEGLANGTIDILAIQALVGSEGYYTEDVNMNGLVNSADYLRVSQNDGKQTQVP